MGYERYRAQQDAIYAEFQAAMGSLDELQVDSAVTRPCAGYIIALRHSSSVMESFSQITAAFRHHVPSLRCDAENGHTTLTVHEKRPLAAFQPDPTILDALSRITAQIDREVWQQVRIDFRDWYFNQETIIVAGEPNEVFWQIGEQVQTVGAQYGLELRMPWGAHMTAGRFTEPCDASVVALLRQHMLEAPPLGISVPVAIHVGYYTSSNAGFVLHSV